MFPLQYYFESDTKLITYNFSDAKESIVKNDMVYSFNKEYDGTSMTVLLLEGGSYIQITGWMLGSRPSFCMVHPIAINADVSTVYAVSIYEQMTDKELKTMQESVK